MISDAIIKKAIERLVKAASYAIALSSPKDKHHKKALKLAAELEAKGFKMVTTEEFWV